jgi:dynein intermediate chain 2
MADTHEYTKARKLFGRHAQFEDSQTKAVCEQHPSTENKSKYLLKNPNRVCLDNIAVNQAHTINTERIETKDKGMSHDVGGWPRDYDHTDEVQVTRYVKKLSKDATYKEASKDLTRIAERCIKQNNEIDLFEEYFAAESAEAMADDIYTKTLMIFKDPNQIKRAVTKFHWKVDGADHRLAIAYAQLRFQ